MFILDEVPDPVWNTSIGNWASHWPSATSRAASAMASATSLLMAPSWAFSSAAARLSNARARTSDAVDLLAGHGEVVYGPLGLGLPLGVKRDPYLAHRVVLHPVASRLGRFRLCCVITSGHYLQPSGAGTAGNAAVGLSGAAQAYGPVTPVTRVVRVTLRTKRSRTPALRAKLS